MAKPLTCIQSIVGVCLLAMAGAATAEVLVDPTRPPAALNPALANASGVQSGPMLQSVLISGGRKVAIISGKEVRMNEKFGEARVVRITETEVVLRSGRDVQTLKLFPEMDKRSAQSASQKKLDKRMQVKEQ